MATVKGYLKRKFGEQLITADEGSAIALDPEFERVTAEVALAGAVGSRIDSLRDFLSMADTFEALVDKCAHVVRSVRGMFTADELKTAQDQAILDARRGWVTAEQAQDMASMAARQAVDEYKNSQKTGGEVKPTTGTGSGARAPRNT